MDDDGLGRAAVRGHADRLMQIVRRTGVEDLDRSLFVLVEYLRYAVNAQASLFPITRIIITVSDVMVAVPAAPGCHGTAIVRHRGRAPLDGQ
jgi:hypothetical protein